MRGSAARASGATVNVTKTGSGVTSFSDEEKVAFVEHINGSLGHDPTLKDHLPISTEGTALFDACSDGIVLCKLINDAVPDTLDDRVLNYPKSGKQLSVFQKTENNNLAINSAKSIGCTVVNVGDSDLREARPNIILGLVWQIIRVGLLSGISLTAHPELFRLLQPGEDIDDLMKLPPEQILLRWVNYHLANAGSNKRIKNFSGDIKDSEAYTILLKQLAPDECDTRALQMSDHGERADAVLQNAEKIGCRKFLHRDDIVHGNPKLNLAFVANLFNARPGLAELTQEEMAGLEEWLFASEGSREARAFCLWLNSLGIDPYVNNLFEDLRDGLVILRAMDKINPGCVDWKKVAQTRVNKFKAVANCNIAVDLGHDPFAFSLVGIGGSDIQSGNKTLTLALVWQLMRHHTISILDSLTQGGKKVKEEDIIAWANKTVADAGKGTSMRDFGDPSLRDSLFFIDLLAAIREKSVNYELVTDGKSAEDATQNAKYAISIARKLGCCIFVLPEDILEVKKKMMLTFVGSIMSVGLQMGK